MDDTAFLLQAPLTIHAQSTTIQHRRLKRQSVNIARSNAMPSAPPQDAARRKLMAEDG